MSELCERTDADIELVARGMGLDPRIGKQFLRAGIGFGGSCFPKDLRALAKIGEDLGVNMNLLKDADNINLNRIEIFVEKIKKALWILKDKKIAVLGLSFKPETDDIRESPSIKVIERLLEEGSFLRLYDPKAMENMRKIFPEESPQISYAKSPYEAVKDANALLIITEWDEFIDLDLKRINDEMANSIIIDGRNIYIPSKVRDLGFEYYSIGRQ
jgi:UDPglucose 6-dehydrogenase